MINIIGTVRNTIKLAELDSKWKQKKESGSFQKKAELTPEMKELQRYQEQLAEMREQNQMSAIDSKLKSGGELSPEEIEYLKRNNPQAYREYEEIQRGKQAYERQLKSCRTKEEVEKLKQEKMGSLLSQVKSISSNPNIPKSKKLALMEKLLKKTNGIQEVHMEFTKSLQYQSLPTEEELAKRKEDTVQEADAELEKDTAREADVERKKDTVPEMSAELQKDTVPERMDGNVNAQGMPQKVGSDPESVGIGTVSEVEKAKDQHLIRADVGSDGYEAVKTAITAWMTQNSTVDHNSPGRHLHS